jgi:hypothetical protein
MELISITNLAAFPFLFFIILVFMISPAISKADMENNNQSVQNPGMRVKVRQGEVQAVRYTFHNICQKPSLWHAQWIWLNNDVYPGPKNAPTMTRFRKEITLTSAPQQAHAWISADVIYRLYINGRLVSRGPADIGRDYDREMQGPRWMYDYRDLTPFFHSGKNVIAAEVFTEGYVSSRVSRGRGFLFEADLKVSGNSSIMVKTDDTWRATPDEAWEANVHYDERKETPNWRIEGFDDTAWPYCSVVPSVWTPLVASELPPLMEARYPLLRIVDSTPAVYTPKEPFKNGHGVIIKADGSFTLQFDRVLAGYPFIKVDGCDGAIMRIIPGERIGQVSRVASITLRNGVQEFAYPFLDSFSVIRVEISGVKTPVKILDAGAIFSSYPVTYRGSFECSDQFLNRLWLSSRWLTQICMQTHHLDSPNHHEPMCDPGDYLIESVENYQAFGEPWLARQDLTKFALMLKDLQYHNFHTSYSLLWLQMLMRYYDYTGDASLIKELAPEVEGLLTTFTSWRGPQGIISEAPNYMFMDWVTINGFECHHPPAVIGEGYMTAFYYNALADGIRMANIAGDTALSEKYARLREEVKTAFNRALWNDKVGLYRDGLPFSTSVSPNAWLPQDKEIETFSPHVNSLAVLYDLPPQERRRDIMNKVMTTQPLNCQPYFMYFILDALDHCGLFEKYGVDQMKRWKIYEDTQTYREDWDAGDYSHAWGGAPLIELSACILGVKPMSPGFGHISIRPHPSGLKWAKGAVPTPHGPIKVEWKISDGKFTMDVDIPKGCEADIELPSTNVPTAVRRVVSGRHQFSEQY